MENGFLNARGRHRDELLRAYGLWCWRMGLPMIWYQSRSSVSRLSRVHLDWMTTPLRLSVQGRAALMVVSARFVAARNATISPQAGTWDKVGPQDVEKFARAIFRTVRRPAHYESEVRPAAPRLIPFPTARLA